MRAAADRVVDRGDAVDGAGRHAFIRDGRLEGRFAQGKVQLDGCDERQVGQLTCGAVLDCTSISSLHTLFLNLY